MRRFLSIVLTFLVNIEIACGDKIKETPCKLLENGTSLTWEESFKLCREHGGYLLDSNEVLDGRIKESFGITVKDDVWTSVKSDYGLLYSLRNRPKTWNNPLDYVWRDIPINKTDAHCVTFNIIRNEWGVKNCSETLKALCFNVSEPRLNGTNECKTATPVIEVSTIQPQKIIKSQNIFITHKNITNVQLTCKIKEDSRQGHKSVLWVRDGIYLPKYKDISNERTDDTLVITFAIDYFYSSSALNYSKQGTYWCEIWNYNCGISTRSQKINIIFSEVETVLIYIEIFFTEITHDPPTYKEIRDIKDILKLSTFHFKAAHQCFNRSSITCVTSLHIYTDRKINLNTTDVSKNNAVKSIYHLTTCTNQYNMISEWKTAGALIYNDSENLCVSCNMGSFNASAYWSKLDEHFCNVNIKDDIDHKVQNLENKIITKPINELVDQISDIAQANVSILEEYQLKHNTTTRLLNTVENILLDRVSYQNKTFHRQTNQTNILMITSEIKASRPIIGFFSDSKSKADELYEHNLDNDTQFAIVFPDDVMKNYSIEYANVSRACFAVFVNTSLTNTLKNTSLLNKFENTSLLKKSYHNYKLNNAFVISSLKLKDLSNLKTPVKIYFILEEVYVNDAVCVYWEVKENNGSGAWITDGCIKKNGTYNGLVVCLCNHLTAFSLLIKMQSLDEIHAKSLSLISIIGCSLSLFGLSVVIATFLFFRKWRKFLHSKILVCLCITLLNVYLLFLFGFTKISNPNICMVVAACLHYLILSAFSWMFVEAIHQYLRFVKIMGTYIPGFMLKASLAAWGLPLIPVAIILAYNRHLYGNYNQYCWINMEGFYTAFLGPLAIILSVNIIIFILIVRSTTCGRKKLRMNRPQYELNMMRFRMYLTVFLLLGLNWVFGILSYTDNNNHLIFTYLFSITSSLQGFLLFVFFILREKGTKTMWKSLFVQCSKKGKRARDGNMRLRDQIQLSEKPTDKSSLSTSVAQSSSHDR